MNKKPGRNDPCPCGSGKKYKKCCGFNQPQGGYVSTPETWFPQEARTGTLWDEYMELIPLVAIYGKKVSQFEEDGKEFDKAVDEFEKQFRPGEADGIIDSLFVSWMYFDLRFGKSLETIAERFLTDPMIKKLEEPGLTYLRQLSESYLTFYEIQNYSKTSDTAVVEELGTGYRFTVLHVGELLEINIKPNEIWYTRRVGTPERSIFYTTPYIYEPDTRSEFKRIVGIQERDFRNGSRAVLFPPERYFAESQKETTLFWVWYILRGGQMDFYQVRKKKTTRDDKSPGRRYSLVTTDGEELIITESHFRIKNESAFRKRISELRSFTYDEMDDMWIWLKPKSRKYPEAPRSILGSFHIEKSRLIVEANSKLRASRLREKLKRHLGKLITYEKTLYRDPYDFPELSPEKIEAEQKAHEKLNARPEIKLIVKNQLEHHYFNNWPKTKLPALGGLTPLQAVKKDSERHKVESLIADFEHMQEISKSKMPRIDFDKLRRKLGLPPKTN